MKRLMLLTVLLLAGCGGSDPAPDVAAGAPGPTATVPTAATVTCAEPTRTVTTAAELVQALDNAAPGDVIEVADGTYEGNFAASAQGSVEQPITLCGGRGAVLDGGDVDGDYTLHLDGARYWNVQGLTLRGGQKGVMVDSGAGILLEGLAVTGVGDEAIHLRTNSSDNVVRGNEIDGTGRRREEFGEGIYIGSAESNWCEYTDCQPDRSDRNVVEGNIVSGTTAEAVDIKEGTTGGVLRDNTFSGSAITGDADSLVDVKGNEWAVTGNTARDSPEDGFQTHTILDGWGIENVFTDNTFEGPVPGYAINVTGSSDEQSQNTVQCNNTADDAGSGLSNVECRS